MVLIHCSMFAIALAEAPLLPRRPRRHSHLVRRVNPLRAPAARARRHARSQPPRALSPSQGNKLRSCRRLEVAVDRVLSLGGTDGLRLELLLAEALY